jgi:hypothetical protein
MKGKASNDEVELYIFVTPKSRIVWKFAVYLNEETSWYSIKSDYEKYLGLLEEKYGEAKSKYNFFIRPYYEGDGYEVSAVKLDNCRYAAFWDDVNGLNLNISISKYMQIEIDYESVKNVAIKTKELEELNKRTF